MESRIYGIRSGIRSALRKVEAYDRSKMASPITPIKMEIIRASETLTLLPHVKTFLL